MLAFTNESKEIIKKYEELWSKIRDLNSDAQYSVLNTQMIMMKNI